MSKNRTKQLGYYRLRDVLHISGCAVCKLVTEAGEKLLSNLFYERVNDPLTRKTLEVSDGFCEWHDWLAARMSSAQSGLAVIYRGILEGVLERLKVERVSADAGQQKNGFAGLFRNGSGLPPLLKRASECCICFHTENTEDHYLLDLIIWFDEEELRASFDRSVGICLPHLDMVIARYPSHENLPAPIEAQRIKCEELEAHLNEYIRKLDYRFAQEAPGIEKDSWLRAVELLAGKAGVFGDQMRRSVTPEQRRRARKAAR
jgi:hypothetical protein